MAPDKPLDSAVLSRLKQFSAMNKIKKMALRVSLCSCIIFLTLKFISFGDSWLKCFCILKFFEDLKKVTNGFLISLYCLQVIAENLSEEEIAGLKEMFKMIDTDNSGQISFEELKDGLKRFGATLNESEIYDLMQAVSIFI